MFKKLRIKFVVITMVMVAVVMALAFTVVCLVEYQRSYSVVATTLQNATQQAQFDEQNFKRFEADGTSPARNTEGSLNEPSNESGIQLKEDQKATPLTVEPSSTGEEVNPSATAWTAGQTDSIAPPQIGNRRNEPHNASSLIPVAVYQVSADGTARVVPQVTTASISEDVLSEAVETVKGSGNQRGTLNDVSLHYSVMVDNDITYIAFADTSYTDSWKNLAGMLALVGLVTLVVFFVIALFYSRWALRPVREAWDTQKQFVADASHDLKTPLTVVLANTAILLKHPERSIASQSQWIESTQIEAQNMQGLVNEMLDLATIEAGQQAEVSYEAFDFSDAVDGITLLFDSVALERNCTFECNVQPNISILGNQGQIEKMVSTLVENAFKYVNEGGKISVALKVSGKNALFSVMNTGACISQTDLPHIFDRFYRTDKARTSGTGGYGLGLAIARQVAVQHKGDITCASTEQQGTTFTVTLPLA